MASDPAPPEPHDASDAHGAGPRPHPPAVTVTACPDGPLLVRGPADITTPDGRPVPRHRATVALCRCGGTAIPPWCDGTHKANGYRTPR